MPPNFDIIRASFKASLNNPPEGGRGATSLDNNNNFCNKQASPSNSLSFEAKPCEFYPDFRYYHPKHGFRRFNCRSWKCKPCSKKRIRKLRKAILYYVGLGFNRHLTITLDPKKSPKARDPKQSYSYLMYIWARLRIEFARAGLKVSFIWFVQPNKRGIAHLHVLLNQYIPQSWLSYTIGYLGGGEVCWIYQFKQAKVAYYVSRYLTKLSDLELPPYKRRYSSSHDVKLNQFKAEPGWKVVMPLVVFWGITWKILWVRVDRRDFKLAKAGLSPPGI